MISLCFDKDVLYSALSVFDDCPCLRNIIKLYLNSYGTEYRFCEFYLQYSADNCVTCVILRYNNYIYCVTDIDADRDEISSFLYGFADSVIVADSTLFHWFESFGADLGAVMQKFGDDCSCHLDEISSVSNCCSVISEGKSNSEAEDVFLNFSLMHRRGELSFYSACDNGEPISVVAVSRKICDPCVITAVSCRRAYRNLGITKKLLSEVCVFKDTQYMLLCEKHNIEFYKKCGFSLHSEWMLCRL